MPSSASPLLRLELQATGENLNAWGGKLNALFSQTEEAIASLYPLTITGDYILTATNYASNDYRRAALILNGSPAANFTITVPAIAYPYRFINRTGKQATIKTASGVAAVVRVGMTTTVLCDGTDCTALDPTLDQIKPAAGNVAMGGNRITGLGATTADTDAISRGEVVPLIAPQVALAQAWATSTAIVSGGFKGAYGYAQDAAGSASAAAGSASAATTSAGNAATSATNAGTSATNASNSATAAATSASQAQAAVGGVRVTASDTTPAPLSQKLTGSGVSFTTQNPGGNEVLLLTVGAPRSPVTAKAATFNFAAGDLGQQFLCSGTFAIGSASAATLAPGWFADLRNNGMGIQTFTPGSGVVDGRASIAIYPGEAFRLLTDGTNFFTEGRAKLVLVSNAVVSGTLASVDFTVLTDTEIQHYDLDYSAVTPDTAGSSPQIRLSYSAVFQTSGYASNNSPTGQGSIGLSAISIGSPYSTTLVVGAGNIRTIGARANRAGFPNIIATNSSRNPAAADNTTQSASFTVTGAQTTQSTGFDGLRFLFSSGNIASGTFNLYGRRA